MLSLTQALKHPQQQQKKKCVVENSHSELFLRVYKSVWAYAHVRGRLGEILTCEPWTTRSFPVRFCLDLQTNARTAQPGYTKCVVLFKFRCSEDALAFILYYTEVTLRSRNPLKRSLRVFAPKEHPSFFYGGSPCTASAGGGVTTRARFKQDFLEGLNRSYLVAANSRNTTIFCTASRKVVKLSQQK